MELIPILSFIILVATISTFILAVGAYILYKIRESKGRNSVQARPQVMEADLYSPAQVILKPDGSVQPVLIQDPVYSKTREQNRPVFINAQQERAYNPQEETYQSPRMSSEAKRYQVPNQAEEDEEGQENRTDKKFMKYTSEGYIPVTKTKNGDNLKWR